MRAASLPVRNISGGEASVFPLANMPSKYSTLMQNCYVGENGLIEKAPGYVALNTAAVAETLATAFDFIKSTGTLEVLCAGGGKIYSLSGGVLSAIKTGLDTSALVYFSQMNNLVIMTNGVDAPMKYDGTTVSAVGGTPPSKAFKSHVHKNRAWMLDRTDKMMAYHSVLNNPEDWTSTGSGYIDFKYVLPAGDELVDIATYLDLLVFVFKNHIAIYSGTTPSGTGSDFALVQLIDGVGAVNTGGVVPFGTDIAVVTAQGIVTLRQVTTTGGINAYSLSEAIEPTLRDAISAASTSTAISAVHYKKYGWLLFSIGGVVYGYSYTWKAWFRLVGMDAKGLHVSGRGVLYIAGTGFLYEYDSGWDFNGVSPVMVWGTAWLALAKSTGDECYPKVLEISTKLNTAITLDIAVEYDFNGILPESVMSVNLCDEAPSIDGVIDFDGISPLDVLIPYEVTRIPLFGGGRLMRVRFSNTSDVGPIEIAGFTVFYSSGRR